MRIVMPRIEAGLELAPDQSSQTRSALLARYDREAELTRCWEAGEDPIGEIKRSDRERRTSRSSPITCHPRSSRAPRLAD